MKFPGDWIVPDWPAPPHVRAFITSRNGGVSRGPYTSFNLGLSTGDDPEAVRENRARLMRHLPQAPAWLQQQHSENLTIRWNEFQDLLTRGKEANRVNGLLINKHFNRNKQVLDVLHGTRQTGQFYGPDGQASAGSALRGGVLA